MSTKRPTEAEEVALEVATVVEVTMAEITADGAVATVATEVAAVLVMETEAMVSNLTNFYKNFI